mgnify:CR=1 FL=1|jgi:nitrite reductase/ring-hydroxylating ferredoxin subunit|tara:strand:+ start:214 stop:588 length:375 start_codon:yes stop_codon:yes gene_type:complete
MKKVIKINTAGLNTKKFTIKLVEKRKIGIYSLGQGKFKVYEMTCPHMGGDLCNGMINKNTIQCSWHGYLFSLVSGNFIENPSLKGTKSARIKSLFYDPQNSEDENLSLKSIDYKIIDKNLILEI